MTEDAGPRIGIVTGERAPDLSDDGQALQTTLQERGLQAEPVVWTDSTVEWETFDAVLVRSCWDYYTQADAFLNWLDRLASADVRVRNPPAAIRWNVHKFYLRDLADAGVSIIPTACIDRGTTRDLQTILQNNDWEEAVVKPAIGTSSDGVWRTSLAGAPAQQYRFEAMVADDDVLVQQFAPEIREGERSLVFFGGSYRYATTHRPAADDFRSHHQFGGTSDVYDPSGELIEQASDVLETAAREIGITPAELPYARVDGIERGDAFRLMELELVEPYLSLDDGEGAVAAFADAIESSLDLDATSDVETEQPPQDQTDQ